MTDIDLDAILDQRAEARNDAGYTFQFKAYGKEWTALDPMLLTDEQKEELSSIDFDIDMAEFFMGSDQLDQFLAAGGQSSHFVLALTEYQRKQTGQNSGRPTRPNRSSRRAEARKQPKQR